MISPTAASSALRILRADGTVVGAGFLVDFRHAFTCAHVVAEALGLSPFSPTCPDEPILLDFPTLPSAPTLRASVIIWHPINEDGEGGDIAGLELLDEPPEGAQPATFAPTTDVWAHEFRAFGFPAIADKGTWSTGRLLAKQGNGWIQIEDNRGGGMPITQGFSGAAVWDEQLEGVVGMVVATLQDPGERVGGPAGIRVAFAIPQRLLLTAWPLIRPITRPRVFLSAAQNDSTRQERLRTELEASNILVWDGQHGPASAPPEAEHGQQAIRNAMALLVIASPSTAASLLVREHLRLAELYQRRIVFIPSWQDDEDESDTERKLAEIARQNLNLAWINAPDTSQNGYKKTVQSIKEMLSERSSITALLDAMAEQPQMPRNPYVGLRAFTARERGDFFGREAFVDRLHTEIVQRLDSGRMGKEGQPSWLLTVIGASGSGKSSVVMAGLLPRLQEDVESEHWLYLERMVPGSSPLEALIDTLSPHFPDTSFRRLREDLTDDSTDGLHRLAGQLARGRARLIEEQDAREGRGQHEPSRLGTRVVLFIDQFEELFTQTVSEEERRRFLDLLATAASAAKSPLLILLTLRADFYSRLMEYPDFYALLASNLYPLLPLQSAELRAAIARPAAQPDVQLTFEGDLLGDLLFDVQRQAGALPLLQFTLQQLYERRQGARLTLKAYKEIGEVNGALARYAQSTYEDLPPDQRELARVLFLRLLEPGSSPEESTRRRASFSELAFPDPDQTRRMQAVIDTFVTARLLTSSAYPLSGQSSIEVSHEALIRAWPQLADWLRAARNDLPLQRKISEDAAQWQSNHHPPDRLYRGSQLKQARTWAARNTLSVTKQEQMFLRASRVGRVHTTLTWLAVLLLVLTLSGATGWLLFLQPNTNYNLVINTNDNGPGSLRWAIANVQDYSIITFAASIRGATIILTSGDIHIRQQNLIIKGLEGRNLLTVSNRNYNGSVIIDSSASVTIDDMAFRENDNNAPSVLINNGKLKLQASDISYNTTSSGSISNIGTLSISDSFIYNNIAGFGGGISNSGTLDIDHSSISANVARIGSTSGSGNGGGIYNDGRLSITNSSIFSNTANFGGGVYNLGDLFISDSIIFKNTARDSGGGIATDQRTFTIARSIISNNISAGSGGGISLYNSTNNSSLVFCTIYPNRGYKDNSDGVFLEDVAPGSIHVKATIIAGSDIEKSPVIVGGTTTSEGYNLIQNMSSSNFVLNTAHMTDRSIQDTKNIFTSPVEHVISYGLRLSSDNPAVNSVPTQVCREGLPLFTHDLRKLKNMPSCDIGAYQYYN